MELTFSLIFVFKVLIVSSEELYRRSRKTGTWREASRECSHFGGRLADLEDTDGFRNKRKIKSLISILDSREETWVAGQLVDEGWKWEGQKEDKKLAYTGGIWNYKATGCYRQEYWVGGIQVDQLTPLKCFQICGATAAVGLKKNYCLCEENLSDVELVNESNCQLACEGDVTLTCGGPLGLSIYQPGSRSINWGAEEPRSNADCALLRRLTPRSTPELVSSSCGMQSRFVCSFSSSISKSYFHNDERMTQLGDNCAVLLLRNGRLGLAARSCSISRKYICQYDSPRYEETELSSNTRTESSAESLEGESDTTVSFTPRPRSLTLCVYVAIGFICGMIFALVTGGIIICCVRFRLQRLSNPRATRLTNRKQASCVLCYSKGTDPYTREVEPEPSIGTYESVYDLETESPFRRIQCEIRPTSESVTTPVHEQETRHVRSSNFTWRGMINGKEELINTELRRLPSLDINVRHLHHPSNETNENVMVTDGLVENKEPLQKSEDCDINTWYSPLSSHTLKTIVETETDGASCILLQANQNKQPPNFTAAESQPSAADTGYTSIQKVFQHKIEARQQGITDIENDDEAMMYSVQIHRVNLS